MSGNTKSIRSDGYTLVELLISITVFGFIAVGLFGVCAYYFQLITRTNHEVEMTVDSQNLLRSTAEQLRYGAGVRVAGTINDTNAPAGGWTTSNANFVIIIASPAKDSAGNYIVNPDTGNPYNNELVYYKSGTTLYRRTLAHPDATGNTTVMSCPPSSATATCPADARLIDNVDNMVFTLYDQDDATTTNPLLARSINIVLSMRRNTFGGPLTLENSLRITLRNNF